MNRAAILIGVNKTGNLPMLHDAAAGARRMEAWTLQQGLAQNAVRVFTDENGPIEVRQIKKAIRDLVDSTSFNQLIVYFAGHGVNLHRSEYWLLSDAPVDTQEAINVEGSVALARRAGIPHVVFISDACRTAAEGIQAQAITGSEIFPNDEVSNLEQSVDIFFASTLGRPAFEIKDPNETSTNFKALYTDTLIQGLQGNFAEAIQVGQLSGKAARLVRPRLLKKTLQAQMARRIISTGLQATVNQVPDARITSDDEAWLATLPLAETTRGFGWATPSGPISPSPLFQFAPRTLQTVSDELLSSVLRGDKPSPRVQDIAPKVTANIEVEGLIRGVEREPLVVGPLHFETRCGFRIEGMHVLEALCVGGQTEVLGDMANLVRVDPKSCRVTSVLLVLEDKSSVLIPAVAEFITSLRFDNGELVDVSYEPSKFTWRWDAYQQRLAELRTLRNTIAAAAQYGVFRLEGDNVLALARRMQYSKSVDPALALYAAYAYHDLQRQDLIHEMANFLQSDLGFIFTDIGLVGRMLDGKRIADEQRFAPCIPMLAQGWSLLQAFRIQLPNELQTIQQHIMPSLWSQFTPTGTALLRSIILSGRIR